MRGWSWYISIMAPPIIPWILCTDLRNHLPVRVVTPNRIGNWVAATNFGLSEARASGPVFYITMTFGCRAGLPDFGVKIERAEGALVLHNAVFIGPDGRRLGPGLARFPKGSFRR